MVEKLYAENVNKFYGELEEQIADWESEQFNIQLYDEKVGR